MLKFNYDGRSIEGGTPTDIVQTMSETKLRKPRSLKRYRQKVRERAMSVGIIGIETFDDLTFLRTLCEVGLMEPGDFETWTFIKEAAEA